jgi:hypothetical protein
MMSNKLLAAPAMGIALSVLLSGSAIAQLAGPARETFLRVSLAGCLSSMRQNHPEVSAAPARVYCTCMADKGADITTAADLAYITEHKTASEDYRQEAEVLATSCRAGAGSK